jgi:hypothetical protein
VKVKSIGRALPIIGSMIIIIGIVFTLQSLSIVGPSSSFMYRNQDWTVNGGVAISIGVAILVLGVALRRLSSR